MTLRLFESFDTGDILPAAASTGTFSISNSHIHSPSGFALRSNPTAGTGRVDYGPRTAAGAGTGNLALTTAYTGFWFYPDATSSGNTAIHQFVNSANASIVLVRYNSAGTLTFHYVNGSDSVALVSGSVAVTVGVPMFVEMAAIDIGNAGNSIVEWRVNGVVIATATGLTVRSSARTIDKVRVGCANSTTTDIYIDDVYVDDAGYLGEVFTKVLVPTSVRTADGWGGGTAGPVTPIDEVDGTAANDGDTSYIKSTTANEDPAFEMANLAGTEGAILGVESWAIVRDEGGASGFTLSYTTGGTATTLSVADPGATYVYRSMLAPVDAFTGAAFTPAAVNGIGLKVYNDLSVALRVTAAGMFVYYTAPLVLTPGTLALTTTAFAPTVTATSGTLATPSTLALITALFAPTVLAPRLVTPTTLALTLSAFAPSVLLPQVVTPTTLALLTQAFAPSIIIDEDITVTPDTLALVLTTYAPGVGSPQEVTPGTLALSLTAFAPTIVLPQTVTPSTLALLTTGYAPTVSTPVLVVPSTLALVTASFAPVLAITTNALVIPETLALTLTMFAPTAIYPSTRANIRLGGGTVVFLAPTRGAVVSGSTLRGATVTGGPRIGGGRAS